MPNVLIRDVPPDDLEQIKAAATAQGTSAQSYLLDVVHAQAKFLRRRSAIDHTAERLHGMAEVTETERDAVLAAIDRAHDERSAQLDSRPAT